MPKFYVYEVNRTKAYRMDEQGVYTQVHAEEKSPYFSNEYYEEYRTLLAHFTAYDYNDIAGEVQIIKDGEIHDANELFSIWPSFSVVETAAMLQLSDQRIRKLIADGQLIAKKRASIWLLAGKDILEFSLKERPAHRPSPKIPSQTP